MAVWGASFLFMAEGLEAFEPGVVTLARVGLGALALTAVPAARRGRIEPEDRPRVVALAVLWIAVPFTLFPLAQQWIDSAVAGMLNGAMPLMTAVVTGVLLGAAPGRAQVVGLLVGFAGVVAVSLPTLGEGDNAALGVVLVIAAVSCYAVSASIAPPLQQRYGSAPVMLRVLWVATALVAPFGLVGLPGSRWATSSALAMVAVGVLGTGLAMVAMGSLVGRAGATRASTITYVIPLVALALGALLRDEHIAGLAVAGGVLVITGAAVSSRAE